ncbi:MAG TPA: hypothetical protein VF006_08535 [Longimicrobium sp.]
MRTTFVLAAAAVLGAAGCTDTPMSTQGPSRLDGMYLVPVEWPDTMVAGQIAIATVQLVLASGVPYEPERYGFYSPDVRVVGLHPTSRPESKQVLAFAPGTVTLTMEAHIDSRQLHCTCPGWHAELTREIVVLPAR